MKARNDKLYLYDILKSCEKIADYTSGVSEAAFLENGMLQDALVRNIEIIGEASKNLSEDLRNSNPQIAWREIMRMRDKIVHHYFRINPDAVWQTVSEDIPHLRHEVNEIYTKFVD